MTAKETADLLDQAIKELAKKKERAKQLAAEAKPDRERLESLLAKLEDHPQEERRQLLDAAGLGHISAAPKPIKPLSGAHAHPLSHDTQRHATPYNAPAGDENHKEQVAVVAPKALKKGVSKAEILTVSWPIPDGAPSISNILDKQPKWAGEACIKVGRAGKGSHLWNPAVLAICLATRTPKKQWTCRVEALAKVIRSHFSDYIDEWESKKDLL